MVLKDAENPLVPKAAELLQSLYTRRLDLDEVRQAIEGIALPPVLAGSWYRALASAAAARNPELENWALRKALEAGPRDPDLLLAVQASWSALGNVEAADAMDRDTAEAMVAAGRPAEALPALRRLCESSARSGTPLPLDPGTARAILSAAPEGKDVAPIRGTLRAILAARLGGAAREGDYNLAVLDFDPPAGTNAPEQRLEAFYALLSDPRPGLREAFAPNRDLRFLFRAGGACHLIAAGNAAPGDPDPALFAWAGLAAQFEAEPFAVPARPRPEPPDTGERSRRSISLREGHAIANLDSMVPILTRVFGMAGFAHPELKVSIDSVRDGAARFFRTGINSEPGYGRLVGLYCATNGMSNDFLSFLLRLYNPPYRLAPADGVLGRITAAGADDIAAALRRDGLYRFPRPIPPDLLEDLIRIGHTMPCYPHPESGVGKEPCVYPAGAPKEIKYDFIERDLVPTHPVQRLMADPGLLAVSQAYLGAKPVLDAVAMWWSTHLTGQASSEAAQLYHFDMERIKWLKWFVYLTDVTTDTGPHCFVRGSHRTGGKPFELLKRGYQRISDSDMARHYPEPDLLELNGPKGSIFVEDTSGFHKGKPPRTGPRLVIELEFTNSLYGALFNREAAFGKDAHSLVRGMAEGYPQVLCKYALHP